MFRRRWTSFDCFGRRGKHGVAQCRDCWGKRLLIVKASVWCLGLSALTHLPPDWATRLYFSQLGSSFSLDTELRRFWLIIVNQTYKVMDQSVHRSLSPAEPESDRCWHISSCRQFNYRSTALTMTSLNITLSAKGGTTGKSLATMTAHIPLR